MKRTLRILAAALPAALLLPGCKTAEQIRADRIQRNQAVFQQLAPEAQQRAAAGTFAIGDPAAVVWFALGEPSSKSATRPVRSRKASSICIVSKQSVCSMKIWCARRHTRR